MAVLGLTQVFVAAVSDLATVVAANSTGINPQAQSSTASGTDVRTGGGQTRMYAAGNVRNVTTPGTRRVYTVVLELLTMAQFQTLEAWMNKTVLLRDSQGRKCYGVYNQVKLADWKGLGDAHEVTITVTEVSYSEAV